jgi:hypothetical protein
MKREKRLTKKERKAVSPLAGHSAGAPGAHQHQQHERSHIHCVACGKHLDPDAFGPGGADFYRCQHGGDFPHCGECADQAKELVDEHDRTGKPVKSAQIWH